MHPEIIRFGNFAISSFGLMMVIAFLTGNYLLRKDMKAIGKEPDLADEFTFRAAIGGILGAKIYYIIENIPTGYGAENLRGLWDILAGIFTLNGGRLAEGIQNFGAGMVFYGGFIGGLIAVLIFVHKHDLSLAKVADWIAPYLVLGHAIGRIGCFLVGDDYGIPSNLPWAVAFPKGAPPTDIPVHPTQLYEVILYGIIFIFLYRRRFKNRFEGELISYYLILVGIARFFVEFIRTNTKYFLNLSGAQYISVIMVIIGSIVLYKNRYRKADNSSE
ncbi:MAG: prolipoprotein diacylglyceryl transferase [FCB group bacterium]|nr:prolipoprotein diacylglyceryl transferase [FCB group bacterium]